MNKIIGIDVGYGFTKVVTDAGGMVVPLGFPSVVGTCEDGLFVDGLKAGDRSVVSVNKQRFLVGDGALKHGGRILNAREKDWITSTAYQALLMHALRLAECNSANLTIITGLPVNFYRTDKDGCNQKWWQVAWLSSLLPIVLPFVICPHYP